MTTTTTAPTIAEHARVDTGLDAVTGAFSYSGRAIARRLLAGDRRVRTLTGHPQQADPAAPIDVRPLCFADMPALVRDLEGVTTLYNTYWVRFAHGDTSHAQAGSGLPPSRRRVISASEIPPPALSPPMAIRSGRKPC